LLQQLLSSSWLLVVEELVLALQAQVVAVALVEYAQAMQVLCLVRNFGLLLALRVLAVLVLLHKAEMAANLL
jgi:hypothetical protein